MPVPAPAQNIRPQYTVTVSANSNGHVGQIYYNRLKNYKIKSIAFGALSTSFFIAALYSFKLLSEKGESVTLFHAAIASMIYLGLLLVFRHAKFGQVIEVIDEKAIATYYELGTYKINYQTFPGPAQATLEQDRDRYYCLAIRTSTGQSFILERHPTLREANERLEELKTILG